MAMPLNSSPGSLNRAAGWVNLAAFISCVPAANWLIAYGRVVDISGRQKLIFLRFFASRLVNPDMSSR